MAFTNTTVKQVYNGNGILTVFNISPEVIDKIENPSEIKIYLVDTTTDPYTETLKVVSTDYTFDGSEPPVSITMLVAPTSSEQLMIVRTNPETQEVSLDNNATFVPKTQEKNFDKIIALIQELNEKIQRAVKFRLSSTALIDLPLPDPSPNRFLRWNDDGDALENANPIVSSTGSSLSTAASSTNNAIVRWDGTAGDTVQDSSVTVGDSGDLSGSRDMNYKPRTAAIANSQSSTSISGMSVNSANETSAKFIVEITRGTPVTIMAIKELWMYYKNGAWVLLEGAENGDITGIDWNNSAGQIQYTSDASGSGNFKWRKEAINV